MYLFPPPASCLIALPTTVSLNLIFSKAWFQLGCSRFWQSAALWAPFPQPSHISLRVGAVPLPLPLCPHLAHNGFQGWT